MKEREYIASCPKCATLETLWFDGHKLVATMKFHQNGYGEIYHDCGSKMHCRLFPKSKLVRGEHETTLSRLAHI